MKAAVFYEQEDLRLEDVPEPEAGPDEVVVRVLACGFCGSDIEYYYGKSPLWRPAGKGRRDLGHEMCGEIVQAGNLAERYGLAEGDRVAVNPVQSCNACNACRAGKVAFCQNLTVLGVTTNGGFAEFAKTKIVHAYKLPDELSDEQGAFVEMLSSAVYATKRAEVEPGNFAVVYGPGPVGLSMVQLLRNEGARVALVGTRDYRLEIGKELGADHVWNTRDGSSPYWVPDLAKAIEDVNGGQLADRVLVATANVDANQQAVEISGQGSIVVLMGLAGPKLRESGLKATTCIPGVLSIFPVPFPGPQDPEERTEALCAAIRRFAAFEPEIVLCLTGHPGHPETAESRQTIVEGLRVAAR